MNLTASLIKDIKPGSESSELNLLTTVNRNLLFSTSDFDFSNITNATNTVKLWKTDGTESGTVVIDTLSDGFSFSFIMNAIGVTDAAFISQISGDRVSIIKSDGTESGTFIVDSLSRAGAVDIGGIDSLSMRGIGDTTNLTSFNDTAFYTGFESPESSQLKLYKIDKDTDRRVQVKQSIIDGGSNPRNLTAVGDTLFFSANANAVQEGLDRELWKSDGTDAGTVLVENINKTDSSNPESLTNVNGTLFFTADNGTNGRELWKSDGTNNGTNLVKDINPGNGSSSINELTDVNGTAFFTVLNESNGTDLWKSDGTNNGTNLVKDVTPGSRGFEINDLTNVNGTLFFTVDSESNGTELWKSDGTNNGTNLVADINPGENSSIPVNLTNFDGILYFSADDGSNGLELWKSDGTADGTVLVEDINPGSASSNPNDFKVLDNQLFFSADDGVNGRELWGLTKTEADKDLILGGSSNDILLGNEQDNIIDGLKGDDTLTGGAGKDKFVLSDDFGNDVITDFTLGEDEIINTTGSIVLAVASVGDAVKVAFSNTGDVLQVNLNGNDRVELENYLLDISSNQALPY